MRRLAVLLACGVTLLAQPSSPSDDRTPATLDEFRSAVERVLRENGVPGAGISLVRTNGVEWEGGVGFADRDRQTPVTADTHFRVGSISKTFVAMAIVQMYFDDRVGLDDTVAGLAPEVTIDNPWHDTAPVRVIHLLQHTAGFDDMHFNEIYNVADAADLPLLEVLKRNPHSRRVRWPPGTRMAYSNPGYGVAGYLIEKIEGEPYEDYIERKILLPLRMTTSSFRLTAESEKLLAQGYSGRSGPPTGFPPIYYRPAGNFHSSPRELGRFVRMLLNWGQLDGESVVDPEYLGNMERSSTTVAANAGIRNTYGSGLSWQYRLPFVVVGHGGGIEGFLSTYGYSPSRDVGYVILLNSNAPEAEGAMARLSSLAIRYLKRDVEMPELPAATVAEAVLRGYEGFYEDANPRNAIVAPFRRLLAGRFVYLEGGKLFMQERGEDAVRLVPVSDTTFRRETETDATIVFAADPDGTPIVTGNQLYAARRSRWPLELLRWTVFASTVLAISPLVVAIGWVVRIARARPRGFWDLKFALLLCPIALAAPAAALALTPVRDWGTRNAATITAFLATFAPPVLVMMIVVLAYAALTEGASRRLASYALAVALAMCVLTAFLWSNRLIGLRLWAY
jgi:CubicO group peptidase (beta-lactamase class C family)